MVLEKPGHGRKLEDNMVQSGSTWMSKHSIWSMVTFELCIAWGDVVVEVVTVMVMMMMMMMVMMMMMMMMTTMMMMITVAQ